ncbi:uncharacterized protein BDR25DRAFT_242370 [Lindgomyces ingoldianus]|uniref:Uncharacterized protein n=1 Tax=Lindgomyces ingoldianus TaxID=673940 RepID=A0ACB6QD92_9PLEO|nr:uncharacterized protein BDR25DRAFT_242370 [Lindgomyces ingoldianus]KAF2464470.1 hypothetical protein BDR25DRAFT_242370 [Lindgomyces ingoldianus]
MLSSTSILEFPSLRKTRRYGAKVKTGCRTCKLRRVKCDERKPACVRCTSTGRKCDGYAQVAGFNPQALVPTQSSSFRSTVPMLSGLGDSVLYLEFYHHCAAPTLASNFDHEFWSRIVLQMAQSESAVRHAVIALGYLVKTEPGNLKHARSVSASDSRKTLLLHYNKAVRCLVHRMAESSYPIEVGLVTCLLFICIEFLRGDYYTAFTHLHSGLKIIAEWWQRPQNASQSSLPSLPSSIAIAKTVAGPSIISGKLIPMFIRAIATGLLFGAPFEPLLKRFCTRPQILQGRPFTSVLEAQSAIYGLRNATVILVSVVTRKVISGTKPTTKDLQYHAYLLSCHDSWFRALRILEREGKLSREDSVVASSLKISHYSTYIALAGAIDAHQTSFDAHISSFKALNHHAKIVLDSMNLPTSSPSASKQGAAHFTFEISLIPPLYFAAIHCRCPATRRESVSLLARNPPREALWDPKQHAVVARRVIEIEEREVDQETGRPVQRTRLASANIHGDMDENGGFWVSFTSASWMLKGRVPRDPSRRRGHGSPMWPDSEWDEWFVM